MSSRPTPATEERDADLTEMPVLSIRARATGLPNTEELLAIISERVPDASVFAERPPVFVRATASNRNLDSYYTKMAESTHRLFAEGAIEGVSILNSHNSRSLGFGQSFDGRYIAGANARTEVDFYVQRGLRLNEVANDDLIDALRGGSVKDVSVGFIPGWYRCGICNERMQQFYGMAIPTCGHWPGDEYPVSDKDASKGMRTAFAWVEDARLSELSIVYDGATPGAQITSIRARQLISDGRLPADAAERIATRYGIDVPVPRAFAGAEIPPPAKEAAPMLTEEQIAQIRLALTETGASPDADPAAAVRAVVDEVKALRLSDVERQTATMRLTALTTEVEGLRPLADEGRKYRADEVKRALTEGARAYGADFAEATYRGLLESAPLETVQRMASDWAAIGDKQFPGGRLTQETAEPTPITSTRKRRPAAAYS